MKRTLAVLLLSVSASFASCAQELTTCSKLEHAPVTALKQGIPQFIYSGKYRFYVEMRDGKIGSDCDGETQLREPLGVVILSDSLDAWTTRETLHHEVSHIAAWTRNDGKCKFKSEDAAIEHLSPGWVDILKDPRNKPLVEFLTK